MHASISESLDLEFTGDPDDETTQLSEAFTVHSTDELPMMLPSENTFEFGGGRQLEVLITPSVVKSDESLKTLKPSDRLCYFEGERKLHFFRIYTKHNCEIECFSNYSLKTCNCVQFDIVRETDTRVCGVSEDDRKCIFLFKESFRDYSRTGMLASCSCLSPCDYVNYNIEIRESKFQGEE